MESYRIKSNGFFGLIKEPFEHKQHPNQQNGLDLYVEVVNFHSGEHCLKKLYENTKGLHFKHSANSTWNPQKQSGTHYITSFDEWVTYIPFQIIKETQNED